MKKITIVTTLVFCLAAGTLAQESDEPGSAISGSVGVDVSNKYYFRGLVQENQGVVVQPWAELELAVNETIAVIFGTWNSLHSGPTGTRHGSTAEDPKAWYQNNFYGGLSFNLTEQAALGVIYTTRSSPNDSFDTIQDITAQLSFDDTEVFDGILAGGLQPHAAISFEVDNDADGQGNEGVYAELGIRPGLRVDVDERPIDITFPAVVGLSISDYYEDPSGDDSEWGYLDLGVEVALPLTDPESRYGRWTLDVGVHGLFLGSSTERINSSDDFELIGNAGVTLNF